MGGRIHHRHALCAKRKRTAIVKSVLTLFTQSLWIWALSEQRQCSVPDHSLVACSPGVLGFTSGVEASNAVT